MAKPQTVQVLEQARVGPPTGSVADSSLLLTFFDIIWLQVPPVQRLFFYQLNQTKNDILHSIIPNLKKSLSLTLQLFHPLAGNLTYSSETDNHFICYIDGDSIPLTVAESDGEFDQLCGNNAQDVSRFHPLVPPLSISDAEKKPLLALQVTIFPNDGISIGMTINHAAADGNISIHFMKSWASIYRSGCDISVITSLPIIDRSVATRLEQIKKSFLMEMEKVKLEELLEKMEVKKTQESDAVRSTFVLTRADIDRLRQRVFERLNAHQSPRYSSFVLTCAYVWVCLVKARKVDLGKRANFAFAVDCRERLDPPLPSAYFGNCIGLGFAYAMGSDLDGADGIAVGSEAIRRAIGEVNDDPLKDAHRWISGFLSRMGELIVSVAGSPKFRVYGTDFGWGSPKRVDVISIEDTGAISLAESRDHEGGLEIGLALPKCDMDEFVSLFEEGLKASGC